MSFVTSAEIQKSAKGREKRSNRLRNSVSTSPFCTGYLIPVSIWVMENWKEKQLGGRSEIGPRNGVRKWPVTRPPCQSLLANLYLEITSSFFL